MRRVEGLSTRAAGGAGAGAGGGGLGGGLLSGLGEPHARPVAAFLVCVLLVGLRWATSASRECGGASAVQLQHTGADVAGLHSAPPPPPPPPPPPEAVAWDPQAAAAATSPRPQIRDAFTRIYSRSEWGRDGGGSGAGSTLSHTATTRVVLEMLIHRHNVMRLLDAPCGSAHWWPPLLERLSWFRPGFQYVGVDVVESVIEENRRKYAESFPPPAVTFFAADLAQAALPADQRFDLSLCRDALQHLPLEMAIDVIANIARARPRFAAFGSYVLDNPNEQSGGNADIRVGEYYLINLLLPPFSMNGTVDVLSEESPNKRERKHLLLYSADYLASLDFAAMKERARQGRSAFRSRPRRLAVVREQLGGGDGGGESHEA